MRTSNEDSLCDRRAHRSDAASARRPGPGATTEARRAGRHLRRGVDGRAVLAPERAGVGACAVTGRACAQVRPPSIVSARGATAPRPRATRPRGSCRFRAKLTNCSESCAREPVRCRRFRSESSPTRASPRSWRISSRSHSGEQRSGAPRRSVAPTLVPVGSRKSRSGRSEGLFRRTPARASRSSEFPVTLASGSAADCLQIHDVDGRQAAGDRPTCSSEDGATLTSRRDRRREPFSEELSLTLSVSATDNTASTCTSGVAEARRERGDDT